MKDLILIYINLQAIILHNKINPLLLINKILFYVVVVYVIHNEFYV